MRAGWRAIPDGRHRYLLENNSASRLVLLTSVADVTPSDDCGFQMVDPTLIPVTLGPYAAVPFVVVRTLDLAPVTSLLVEWHKEGSDRQQAITLLD